MESVTTAFTNIREVDMKILASLSDYNFKNTCQSNKYLNSLSKDDYLWKLRFFHKYNLINFKKIESLTFKEIYLMANNYNPSPLIWYAIRGYTELVKILLDTGVDIQYTRDLALTVAASNGYVEIVELLLDNGANCNNIKALINAIRNGKLEVVRLLMKYSNYQYKYCALDMAVEYGLSEIIEFLRELV